MRGWATFIVLGALLIWGGNACGSYESTATTTDAPAYTTTNDSYVADDSTYDEYEDDYNSYQEEYSDEGDDGCEPSYPDVCIPADEYDLDCDEVDDTDFTVDGEDPYGFDGDADGVGCESYDSSYEDSYDYGDSGDYYSDEESYSDGYAGDLDCSDFSGPVDTSGGDPHGLDGDGDGVGCEE